MIHYAIPSHDRPTTINDATLRMLAGAGVDRDQVSVFVHPGELSTYQGAVDQGLAADIVPGGLGLAAQRNAIARHYGDGAHVVQVDDDIRQVVRRANDRLLEPVIDLPDEVATAFGYCRQVGARLWGVYPTVNAGWMKARCRFDLTFICGGLFGSVIDQALPTFLDQKEDYERSLRYWHADGAVVRVEWLGIRTRMYGAGGMQAPGQPDRAVANEQAVRWLADTWPGNVRKVKRVGKAGTEIRLVHGT